jgi:phage protein U
VFAVLGDISFEVVGSPERFESTRSYGFAEHRVVESRPRLQWVGNDLERVKFELMLHSSFGNPARQLARLRAAAASHLAQPLVFGNGGFRGFFVIESIGVQSQQLSSSGAPISIRVALALKEWAAGAELSGAGLSTVPLSTLGIASAGASTGSANGPQPGVSALLRLPAAGGPGGPNLEPNDVVVGAIVRSNA